MIQMTFPSPSLIPFVNTDYRSTDYQINDVEWTTQHTQSEKRTTLNLVYFKETSTNTIIAHENVLVFPCLYARRYLNCISL